MTIREIAVRLQNAGIDESDWEAMLIVEHCTGRSRSLLLTWWKNGVNAILCNIFSENGSLWDYRLR